MKLAKIVVAIVILLLIAGYTMGLRVFDSEMKRTPSIHWSTGKPVPDYIEAHVSVSNIDAVKGIATLSIDLKPHGTLATAGGLTMARDIELDVNSVVGTGHHVIHAGHRMQNENAVLEFTQGEISDYPNEHFIAPFEISVSASADQEVPIALIFDNPLHGWKLATEAGPITGKGEIQVDLQLERGIAIKAFAWVVTLVVALISLMLVAVTMTMTFKRKIEFGALTWCVGMLFAIPAMRRVLPMDPPVGVLLDFMVFFWAEIIVALAMLMVCLGWFLRHREP